MGGVFFGGYICIVSPISSYALSDEAEEDMYNTIIYIYNYINNNNEINGRDLTNKIDSIDVKKDITEFYESKNLGQEYEESDTSHCDSLMDLLIKTITECWAMVPKAIKYTVGTETYNNFSINPKSYNGGSFYGIFVTIGYSLVLLFFAANLIENSIKYEIFTLKGGAQLFGRLIISKVFIDLSGKICVYILNICNNIAYKITDMASTNLEFLVPNISSQAKNNTWVVGEILDFIQAYNMLIPVLLILILMVLATAIILVRLILRSIELSLLMIVSPAFFACYSSEITKPYFKNFIMTFIQCAVQIVFISVIYAISSNWLIKIGTVETQVDAWIWFLTMLPKALIALAIAIMMVKPPKVLTNLVQKN